MSYEEKLHKINNKTIWY